MRTLFEICSKWALRTQQGFWKILYEHLSHLSEKHTHWGSTVQGFSIHVRGGSQGQFNDFYLRGGANWQEKEILPILFYNSSILGVSLIINVMKIWFLFQNKQHLWFHIVEIRDSNCIITCKLIPIAKHLNGMEFWTAKIAKKFFKFVISLLFSQSKYKICKLMNFSSVERNKYIII